MRIDALKRIKSFPQLLRTIAQQFPEVKLKFVQNPSLQFPQDEFELVDYDVINNTITIMTNFLGLLGISGALPVHYTEDILHQVKANNASLQEFYDVFHQRIIEHYQHMIKSEIPVLDADSIKSQQYYHSKIQSYLCDLVGLNYQLDNAVLQHNSFYSNPTPSVAKLEQILRSHTSLNISVIQFQKTIESIPENYCNRLQHNGGINVKLSENFVLGDRARLDHVYFEIVILADDYQHYMQMKHDRTLQQLISYHARSYIGNSLKFNVEITIDTNKILPLQLNQQFCLGASYLQL